MAIKKYSKVKFTLRKELIFILAAIVVLVVATILFNLPNEEQKFLEKWQEAGSQITEKKIYEETDFDSLKSTLEDSEGYTFVFYATTESEEAVTYFDTIYNLATMYDVEKVYLLDGTFAYGKDREEDEDLDEKLSDIEANFKKADGETIQLDTVPNFCVFKGDVLVASANDFEVNEVINWNLALISIFSYAKAE